MKIYRAMIRDTDGLPLVGRSARKLGVRTGDQMPNNDVDATTGTDVVQPDKGMSAVPNDPDNLAKNRRPPAVNGGIGKDPVWVMDTDDLGPDLRYEQDKPTHGMVAPARNMTLDEYEAALNATRAKWVYHIG